MYYLSKSTPTWVKLSLSVLSLLIVCGCSEVIISSPGVGHTVTVTTDPPNSRITLESMGSRQVQSATSPAKFSYVPRPGMPTVVTVSKEGYQPKKVRLDPSRAQLHVVLEKMSPYQLQQGGMRGGGIGGGMQGMGRPTLEDIPGMMAPPETTLEEELAQPEEEESVE